MKYAAYGLVWEAAHALPFTPTNDSDAIDVQVRFDANRPERIVSDTLTRKLTRTPNGFCLRMKAADSHWADFVWTHADQRLTIATSRSVDDCWPALVGVIPAILLRGRGRTILHGAVMAIGRRAIAVLGDAGMGKSTLSARLIGRGAGVVTDDLIVVTDGMVERGYTNIGLFPETAQVLAIEPGSQVGVRNGDGKVQVRAITQADAQTPLAAIIILTGFDPCLAAPYLTHQTAPQAFRLLQANLYGRWIDPMTKGDAAFCLDLATSVPVFALARPADLNQLDATCALVEPLAR
jgi:hypothetical protein